LNGTGKGAIAGRRTDVKGYRSTHAWIFPFANHIRLGVYTLNVTNHGNFNAVYNNVASPNFGHFAGFLYRHEGTIIDFVD
jgi:hypothetical protein